MPLAFREFRDLQLELRRNFSYLLLQPRVFNNAAPGVTIYVRDQNDDGSLTGILVHDARRPRLPTTMMAAEGMLVQGADGPLFVMENGSRQELDTKVPEDPDLSILHFDKYTLDLASTQASPAPREPKLKELYLAELLNPDPDANSAIRQRSMIAEGHKRLTWPLTPIVFALIALAALLARPYDRRGLWRTISVAALAAIGFQALTMAAASLATRSLAALPLLYAVPFVTTGASIAIFVLPRRTPQLVTPR